MNRTFTLKVTRRKIRSDGPVEKNNHKNHNFNGRTLCFLAAMIIKLQYTNYVPELQKKLL